MRMCSLINFFNLICFLLRKKNLNEYLKLVFYHNNNKGILQVIYLDKYIYYLNEKLNILCIKIKLKYKYMYTAMYIAKLKIKKTT